MIKNKNKHDARCALGSGNDAYLNFRNIGGYQWMDGSWKFYHL